MAKKRGNNEGTIYQRSNGTYRAQISLNGKRLSFTGETHKACLKWIRKMSTQIDEGMTYEGAKTTLEKFFREWLVMKSTTVRLSTERQYKQIGRDYILPELGSIELLKLKPDQIQTLYNKHIKSGASPRTVELVHAVLRGCLNHAVKLGLISRNPTKAVVPPKPKPKEKLVLDENQIQALLIAAKEAQPAYLPLYQLAITTGMRLGELLGITWDDLDWDKHTLTVNRQLKRIRREGLRLTPPKTKAGRRTLKIGRTTRSLLKEHQKAQFESTVPRDPDWTDKALVFAEEDGSPIGPRKMQKAFKRALAAAGLPDIRFHDLRHTAATHMLANGVDVLTVSRRLGHTKASTTLDIYGHAVPGLQEKAATIMNEITTPVALPDALSSSKLHRVAPELHQEGKS
ncbi:MAG: site-specific integrase [Anaerolineales bacterium]